MVSFIVLMFEANGRLSTDDNFYSVSLSGYRILKQLCAQCIIYLTKVKTLHLNCLPSIYKIMQTKNANESVS